MSTAATTSTATAFVRRNSPLGKMSRHRGCHPGFRHLTRRLRQGCGKLLYERRRRPWIGENIANGSGVVTQETRFVYEGNQIVLQFDESGSGQMTTANLSHRYLWGPATDQLLSDEQVTSVSQPGKVVLPLTDNLGTIRDLAICDLTSGTTSVVNHLDYSSFGQLLSQTNPATGNTAAVDCLFGFTGRPLDTNTGLQNNTNRWYNANLGRWESPDPTGFTAEDTNTYRYVGNSPANAVDPSGERIYFVKRLGQVVGPRQGNRPNRDNYPKGEEGTRAFAKDWTLWNKGGQTPNTITAYILLRYSVANDSKGSISNAQLKQIAREQKALMESAINDANYDYVDENGKSWRVKVVVIFTTDNAESLSELGAKSRGLPRDKWLQEQAKYEVFGEFGAYTDIKVTSVHPRTTGGIEFYNSGLVPASDPKWSDATYQEILVHELIGHGMNNEDEVDRPAGRDAKGNLIPSLKNRTILEDAGVEVRPDAIMSYGRHANRFYQRNWEAGFRDKSNIPGHRIVSGLIGDHTSKLDINDPWFKRIANLAERQAIFDLVNRIIAEATK